MPRALPSPPGIEHESAAPATDKYFLHNKNTLFRNKYDSHQPLYSAGSLLADEMQFSCSAISPVSRLAIAISTPKKVERVSKQQAGRIAASEIRVPKCIEPVLGVHERSVVERNEPERCSCVHK